MASTDDIEHQLPARQEMEDGCDDGDVTKPASTAPRRRLCRFIVLVTVVALLLLIPLSIIVACFVVLFVVCPLFVMISFILPSNWRRSSSKEKKKKKKLEGFASDSPDRVMGDEGIYAQSRSRPPTFIHRIINSTGIVLSGATLLLLVWLFLNTCVPRFKKLTLLGSPLWIWNLGGVSITYSYFLALELCLLPSCFTSMTPSTEYYYEGLVPSLTLMVYFAIHLLSWLLYFSTHHGLKRPSTPHPQAFEYVTWTLVSLFIGSVLCLLKALLLLKWSAAVIYHRFQPRIIITGVKYVHLCAIIGGFFNTSLIAGLRLEGESNAPPNVSLSKYIMSRKLDVSCLAKVGHNLMSLSQTVSSHEEDGVFDILQWFQHHDCNRKCEPDQLLELLPHYNKHQIRRFGSRTNRPNKIKDFGKMVLTVDEKLAKRIVQVLYDIAGEEHSSMTFDDLKKWMVDAHKDCVNMGRTLADSEAMVIRLDMFLSSMILAGDVFLWLLITGLATSQVLVTVATSLLAMTFIFGDTAKTFFQGLVFCFATHPFDVGDRCILDQTELEVKSISILTTTFTKIETEENIFYPNSVLSTKAIVNRGWKPDPSDVVVLTLDPSPNIEDLQDRINKFFDEKKQCFQGSHKVMFSEVGDNIKMTVHFTHILAVHDLTHIRCLQKKREQRSHFLKVIKQFLNESQTIPTNKNDDGNNNLMSYPDASRSEDHSTNIGEIIEEDNIKTELNKPKHN